MHQFKRRVNIFQLLNKEEFARLYERHFLLNTYRLLGQNHFICISDNNTTYFQKNLSKHLSIVKLPNAINVQNFEKKRTKVDPKETLRLVSVGSLTPLKNHSYLVKVLYELIKNSVRAKLDLVGGGPQSGDLQKMAHNLSLHETISIHGKQTEVSSYYQKNTLYIHSASSEGFGLTQIEAMACLLYTSPSPRDAS